MQRKSSARCGRMLRRFLVVEFLLLIFVFSHAVFYMIIYEEIDSIDNTIFLFVTSFIAVQFV
jgi:hypothetical protein